MSSSKSVAWKISTENRFQIFPDGSVQIYLTGPTKILPRGALNSPGIFFPPRALSNIMGTRGIRTAAITSYSDYFYISRGAKSECFTVSFCLSASGYAAKFEKSAFKISGGDVLLIPAGLSCDTSAARARIIWFEIAKTPFWRNILGASPVCRKSSNLAKLAVLSGMYAEELYSDNPSVYNLTALSALISKLIAGEFVRDVLSPKCALGSVADLVCGSLSENWTIDSICRKIGVGKAKLNSFFVKNYGATFSKFLLDRRMELAVELCESGMPLGEIAKRTGFSCRNALSFSFKRYFGFPPSGCRR